MKSSQNEIMEELTAEAHITKSVISIFFRKNVIRYAFGCFQNIVFLVSNIILNSTNPIDKVNFYLIKTKKMFNFFNNRPKKENF